MSDELFVLELKQLLNDIKFYIHENKNYGKTLSYIDKRIDEFVDDYEILKTNEEK